MKIHSRYHWLAVAAVAAVAMLTLSNVHGQRTDSGSMFNGRPAMAGAQAGTGPMAGPPQGGIGVQGPENAGIAVRRPEGLNDMPRGTVDPAADAVAVNQAVRNDRDVVPSDRDPGVAKKNRSTAKKTKRAAKTVADQARHGVSSPSS